jgi:hypothetical protein
VGVGGVVSVAVGVGVGQRLVRGLGLYCACQ